MGLGKKLGRRAKRESTKKSEMLFDSWGAPLYGARTVATEELRPSTTKVIEAEPENQDDPSAARRAIENWRSFRAEALGETAVCGMTGGLVIAESTQPSPRVAE